VGVRETEGNCHSTTLRSIFHFFFFCVTSELGWIMRVWSVVGFIAIKTASTNQIRQLFGNKKRPSFVHF